MRELVLLFLLHAVDGKANPRERGRQLQTSLGGQVQSQPDHQHQVWGDLHAYVQVLLQAYPGGRQAGQGDFFVHFGDLFYDYISLQILFRACHFSTEADGPCETPIPDVLEGATCVYHTQVPEVFEEKVGNVGEMESKDE